eukprot:5115202-Pyramimonas_sp.AAC.1
MLVGGSRTRAAQRYPRELVMAVTRGVELAAGRLLMNLSSPASEWTGADYPASAEPVTLDSDSEEEP